MTQLITMDQQYLEEGSPPLFIRRISPETWYAQLIFVHASMVHSEYYLPIALKWAQEGIRVILPDLRGHGRSQGHRGHLEDFRQHVNDVRRIYDHVQRAHSAPIFLAGESYGALMAYLTCQNPLTNLCGAILIAPSFGLYFKLPLWLQYIMRQLVKPLWPTLRPIRPLSVDGVSVNPEIAQVIMQDRNANRHYTLGFLISLWEAQKYAWQNPLPPIPLLVLLSTGDTITRNDQTEILLQHHQDLELRYHSASAHSLMADQPEFVFRASLPWMLSHLGTRPTDSPLITYS